MWGHILPRKTPLQEPRRKRRGRGEKKKLKVWVRVAGWCKKRQREVSHAKEGEWGNIFHFLFPSSHCQGINRYPLKLIPALCKRMGENRRGGLCTVDPAECDEMGLENGGNRSPLKMLWVYTPLFGWSNLKRFQKRQTGLDSRLSVVI